MVEFESDEVLVYLLTPRFCVWIDRLIVNVVVRYGYNIVYVLKVT